MTNLDLSSEIHNGALCKSYCWSQSHSDLEIRIKLTEVVKYEEVGMAISKNNIKVDILREQLVSRKGGDSNISVSRELYAENMMDGQFEHPVNIASAFWLLDNDVPCIVIYLDKAENMWWKQLLLNEEVTESGPRNYSVAMDNLDDGSRMVIDKLIVEQRNKNASSSRVQKTL